MIVKPSGTSNSTYLVVPEDSDDLFTLRRLLDSGDHIIADTSRLIKQVREYGRPDKGERIKVRLSIRAEQIELDAAVDRLRVAGIITETNNELVSKGTYHSLSVQPGDMITIDKGRRWQDIELRMLQRSGTGTSFVLVAIDTQEAAIARVSGTHVKVIPNIYSGQSGKRYQTKNNPSIATFFSDTGRTVASIFSEKDRIIIFGPGETRRRFSNFLADKQHDIPADRVTVIDGVDVAGEDGIFVFLRSHAMKDAMSASKLAAVSAILDKIMLMVSRGEAKFAMGMQEVSTAASMKAVEAAVFSDHIFKGAKEDQVVKMLNSLESNGAQTYAVDSSTDLGLRVSSLGGIVALLRYAIR